MSEFLNTKMFLLKGTCQIANWSEEIFVVSKLKNTVPWTYVIDDLNGEEIIGTFYEKELQKTNQQEFRIEKVIRRKGDKLQHVLLKKFAVFLKFKFLKQLR